MDASRSRPEAPKHSAAKQHQPEVSRVESGRSTRGPMAGRVFDAIVGKFGGGDTPVAPLPP
jgi:hypothetical protein